MLKRKKARYLDTFVKYFRILRTKRGKSAIIQTVADLLQKTVVKEQIMGDREAHGKHLLRFEEMPHICS